MTAPQRLIQTIRDELKTTPTQVATAAAFNRSTNAVLQQATDFHRKLKARLPTGQTIAIKTCQHDLAYSQEGSRKRIAFWINLQENVANLAPNEQPQRSIQLTAENMETAVTRSLELLFGTQALQPPPRPVNYWLNTKWAPPLDQPDALPADVWLPDGRQQAGQTLAAGDLVLMYQAATGRTRIVRHTDGRVTHEPRGNGREGIVAIAKATGPVVNNGQNQVSEYTNGTRILWCWQAPTELVASNGFVPRVEVNHVFGYNTNYRLRGFGDRKSGLKRLTQEQFDTLVAIFTRNQITSEIIERALRNQLPPGVHPIGGEQAPHRNLKNFVAANPAAALGEPGLTTVRTEYSFATNDRADILLTDAYGRIVGVEVEVDVDRNAIVGILQALKYRAMVELTENKPRGEGRAFLVAYSIAPDMVQIAKEYGVECFTIDRNRVP